MITIHYRTPNSLELSISAGKDVRLFSAFKRERRWVIEEHRGHEVEILGEARLVAKFGFFRPKFAIISSLFFLEIAPNADADEN